VARRRNREGLTAKSTVTASLMSPNFTFLDPSRPEVARLVAVMVQAHDAVGRRTWSHPQEPTGEEWWADVLADPRARRRERRTDLYQVPLIRTRGPIGAILWT
jgi:hypothetical protein